MLARRSELDLVFDLDSAPHLPASLALSGDAKMHSEALALTANVPGQVGGACHIRLQPTATYGCSFFLLRLQPTATYGCSFFLLRLQPTATYGCSFFLLRLQPPSPTVAGGRLLGGAAAARAAPALLQRG
eukprot:scaffold12982_cov37-Phaeocystis_antarctica.AAC.2